jgi:hypothetical protein
MTDHGSLGCEEFAGMAAELALGVLTGRERADAFAHVEQCDACREALRQLTMTGEKLMELLPAVEPPAGFETRVMGRIGITPASAPAPVPTVGTASGSGGAGAASGGRRGRGSRGRAVHARPGGGRGDRPGQPRRSRRLIATAAAAVAIVAGGLGGWGLRTATTTVAPSPISSAPLLSATHHDVGKAYFYDSGGTRWTYMSVDLVSGNGGVSCQLKGANGQWITAGSFRLSDGYGFWASPASGVASPVTAARLVSASGTVIATARFS